MVSGVGNELVKVFFIPVDIVGHWQRFVSWKLECVKGVCYVKKLSIIRPVTVTSPSVFF